MRPGHEGSRGAASPSSSLGPSFASTSIDGFNSCSSTEQQPGTPLASGREQMRSRLMKQQVSAIEGTPRRLVSLSTFPAWSPGAAEPQRHPPQPPTSLYASVVDDVAPPSINHSGVDGPSGDAVADATARVAFAPGADSAAAFTSRRDKVCVWQGRGLVGVGHGCECHPGGREAATVVCSGVVVISEGWVPCPAWF